MAMQNESGPVGSAEAVTDSRTAPTGSRRARRSVRTLVAVVLLVVALVAGLTAIVVGSFGVLVPALVFAVAAGSVAAYLLTDEATHVRHAWAHDRAATARAFTDTANARSQEQLAFAQTMGARVRAGLEQQGRLIEQIRTAEATVHETRTKLDEERRRGDALDAALAASRRELDEARAELSAARAELERTSAEVRRLQTELTTIESAEQALREQLLAEHPTEAQPGRRYA